MDSGTKGKSMVPPTTIEVQRVSLIKFVIVVVAGKAALTTDKQQATTTAHTQREGEGERERCNGQPHRVTKRRVNGGRERVVATLEPENGTTYTHTHIHTPKQTRHRVADKTKPGKTENSNPCASVKETLAKNTLRCRSRPNSVTIGPVTNFIIQKIPSNQAA